MSNENTEGSSLKESVETVQDNNGEANVLKNDGSPGDNAAVSSNNTESKKRKKKVQVACVFCRRSHMICDDKRPCTRCIKRNISHLCHDEPIQSRQKKPKTGNNSSPMSSSPSNQQNVTLNAMSTNNNGNPNSLKLEEDISKEQQLLRQPVNNNNTQRYNSSSNNALNNLYSTFSNNSSNTNAPRDGGNPNSGISVLSQLHFFTNQTNPFFYSEHANSEFSSLNEFLSMIDDPDVVNSVNNQYTNKALSNSNSFTDLQNSNLYNTYSSQIFNNNFPQLNNNVGDKVYNNDNMGASNPNYPDNSNNNDSAKPPTNEMPTISESAKDKFFLTAADPSTEITPEERLKQVIKAKLDAGLLQPYNYAKGYARLQNYMDNYMNQQSRQRILKPLSIFRPAFRAIARTLKDVDLVLVEEAFERMLLDYDRVFTSMAIPACLWRRTGEIYRGNKEFAQLVEVNSDALKDGKLTIYELMSEESAVNFWEKYGAIAFDKGQKAVLTSCNLRTKDGRKRKACCFSFTIRRDRYNIPSCIVGNFIPIDN